MATLTIEGQEVEVSDDFLSLSPDEQNRTVEEIATQLTIRPGGDTFMSHVNKGIAETVGGLADFVNPFDKPHALNPFPEGTGSAVTGIENVMKAGGIDVAQDDPDTFMQGVARGSGQAAGAIVPVAKGLQMLRGVGGPVGQFADDAYQALTSYMGAGAEVVAGGISGGAEELAEDAGAPEWVQDTVAVAAPMSIPAGIALAKAATKVSPVAAATRRVAADLAPYTKPGAKAVAAERMQNLSGGPQRADDLAKRITKDNPLDLTPAQQTQDPNMLAVEKLAASQDPNLQAELAHRATQSATKAKEGVSSLGGDTEAAQRWFAARRKAFVGDLKSRAEAVMKAADERVASVNSARSESENSRIVTEQIRKQLDNAVLKERQLWDAIPKAQTVGTGTTKARAQALVDETPYAQRNDIPRAVNDILNNPEVYGDEATVRELYGAYSELRRVARSAMAGNDQNKNMARIANEVADAILEDLGAKAGTSAVGKKINEARAYSAALHETYDRGAAGRLLKRTLDGDTAIDPELALKRTVGRGGPEGAVTSRQIEEAGGDVASRSVADYIAGQFHQKAVSGGTGEVTMKSAKAFMAKNKELMARYPELRADIEGAISQHETAEQLSARITRRIASLEDAKQSAVARFVGGPADKAIKAVLDAKNPVSAARRIANEARRDASGEALAGVKGAFTEHLIGSSLKTSGAQTAMDATTLNAALANPKMNAAMKQIFSTAEMNRLRMIGRELAKSQAVTSANIGAELSGNKANRVIEMVARIGAAKHGAKLGGSSGGSIQTAGMMSNRAKEMLNYLASDKASQMMADAVTDPELFKVLLTHTGSAKALDRAIPRFIPYLVGGVTGAAD